MRWALLYPMILGLKRSEPPHLVRQNGVLQDLPGLPRSPDAPTLRRFLLRVAPPALPHRRRLHERFLTRRTARPPAPARLLVAVDSPVRVVSGTSAQARIGSNPLKRGRPAYPPLRGGEGRPKDCWPGELRAGDAHTARGTLDRLTACFATRPAGVRLTILRADNGVYDHKRGEWLEARRARCVLVARLTGSIQRHRPPLPYTSPRRGIEGAACRDQPTPGPRAYRFVGVRRPQPEEPPAPLTLGTLGTYQYQGLGTNRPGRPLTLWRCDNDRAGVELLIQQLKGDDTVGRIPTRHCFANETSCPLLLRAYTLLNWFTQLGLPPEFQRATLQTLRHTILLLPAPLRRTDHRPRLAVPASGPRAAAWRYALQKIEKRKV